MKQSKVIVGAILFKDTKYLAHSLPSLLNQDYDNIEYLIRDQSPNGEVISYLKESHPDFFDKATITQGENLMHSGGHNAMIREMMKGDGTYYICASNDMLYPKDFVSEIIAGMEENGFYVGTCKLMQWDYEKMLAGDEEGAKTNKVDSFGISLTKGHHFYEAKKAQKTLGPSGALGVYHKKALEAVGFKNKKGEIEYFDSNLHYKNDCDLAYRLSWAGFPCYLADVKVYHDRQLGEKGKGAFSKLKDHHKKIEWAKRSSLKGHLITLKKNFDRNFSFPVKLKTALNNLLRFGYTLLLAPKMLSVYKEVRGLKKEIEARRKAMTRNVTPRDIEKLMS